MNEKKLSAIESLEIIQSILDQTKQKYEEKGFTILVWGSLILLTSVAQYLLLTTGNADKIGYLWLFTVVPGSITTFIVKFIEGAKSKERKQNRDRMGFIWLMASFMALVTGFLLQDISDHIFITMIWAPFCVAGLSTGLYLREHLLIAMSILAAILAFSAVFIPVSLQSLLNALIALVLMVIPGLKLYQDFKKRNRV